MAGITNVSSNSFIFKDNYGNSYELMPGDSLTIDNRAIPPVPIMGALQRGQITASGWTPSNITIEALNLPRSLTYNPDGTVNYIDIIFDNSSWRQTYTYSGGRLKSVSAWTRL